MNGASFKIPAWVYPTAAAFIVVGGLIWNHSEERTEFRTHMQDFEAASERRFAKIEDQIEDQGKTITQLQITEAKVLQQLVHLNETVLRIERAVNKRYAEVASDRRSPGD